MSPQKRSTPVAAPAPAPAPAPAQVRRKRRTAAELAAAGIKSKPRKRNPDLADLRDPVTEHAVRAARSVQVDIGDLIRADLRSARRESRLVNLVMFLTIICFGLICSRAPKPVSLLGRSNSGAEIALQQVDGKTVDSQLGLYPQEGDVKTLPDGRMMRCAVSTWSLVSAAPTARAPRQMHDTTGLVAAFRRQHQPCSAEFRDTAKKE